MVEIKTTNHGRVFLNPAQVVSIEELRDGGCVVYVAYMGGEVRLQYTVDQPADEIAKIIGL